MSNCPSPELAPCDQHINCSGCLLVTEGGRDSAQGAWSELKTSGPKGNVLPIGMVVFRSNKPTAEPANVRFASLNLLGNPPAASEVRVEIEFGIIVHALRQPSILP